MSALSRWLLLAAITASPGALAANKNVECKRSCEEMAKGCTDSCKQRLKKRAPQAVQYCAPRCSEIKVKCDKDCDDDSVKHKPRR